MRDVQFSRIDSPIPKHVEGEFFHIYLYEVHRHPLVLFLYFLKHCLQIDFGFIFLPRELTFDT